MTHDLPEETVEVLTAAVQTFGRDGALALLELLGLVQRVAALNPDAGEIGPGMLVQLVTDARRILETLK